MILKEYFNKYKEKKVFIYNRKLKLYTAKRNYFTLIPFFKDDTDIKIKHMCKIEHRYKLCLTTQTRFSLDKKTAKNEMKNALEKHIVFTITVDTMTSLLNNMKDTTFNSLSMPHDKQVKSRQNTD